MFYEKKFLYFQKWNFVSPSLKTQIVYKKFFSYISEGNLQGPKNKNFLYFG